MTQQVETKRDLLVLIGEGKTIGAAKISVDT